MQNLTPTSDCHSIDGGAVDPRMADHGRQFVGVGPDGSGIAVENGCRDRRTGILLPQVGEDLTDIFAGGRTGFVAV